METRKEKARQQANEPQRGQTTAVIAREQALGRDRLHRRRRGAFDAIKESLDILLVLLGLGLALGGGLGLFVGDRRQEFLALLCLGFVGVQHQVRHGLTLLFRDNDVLPIDPIRDRLHRRRRGVFDAIKR